METKKNWIIHFLDRDVIAVYRITGEKELDCVFAGWADSKGELQWNEPHKLAYSTYYEVVKRVKEVYAMRQRAKLSRAHLSVC